METGNTHLQLLFFSMRKTTKFRSANPESSLHFRFFYAKTRTFWSATLETNLRFDIFYTSKTKNIFGRLTWKAPSGRLKLLSSSIDFLLTVHHCAVTPRLSLVPAYPTTLLENRRCLQMRLTAPICGYRQRWAEKTYGSDENEHGESKRWETLLNFHVDCVDDTCVVGRERDPSEKSNEPESLSSYTSMGMIQCRHFLAGSASPWERRTSLTRHKPVAASE